jgi:hypothetical protein
VRTYLQLVQQNRRLAKLSREAAAAIGEMRRRNLTLHLEYHDGSPRWGLSDGTRVERDIARYMIASGGLIPNGDTLFSQSKSQTYRVRNALQQLKDLPI